MHLSRGLLPIGVLWIAAIQGCNPSIPPPPPYAMVSTTLELNMTASAAAAMNPYVEDSLTYWVNDSFQVAAMADFQWLPGSWSLPDPPTGGGVWWPASQVESYRQYAQAYGTTGGEFDIQFHAFFVGHMATNTNTSSCAGVGTTYGMTLGIEGVPNQYVWDAQDRASFMFTHDIENLLDACSITDDRRLNAVVGMITHELGHQRAGLTHSDDLQFYEYHVPTYSYTDIMRGNVSPTDLSYSRFHPFCATDEQPPPEGNTESCKGVLIKNRLVQ